MFGRRLWVCLVPALLGAACGAGPPTGPPPPMEVDDLRVVVFYDENGSGRLDAEEGVRVGNIELETEGIRARSEPHTGKAVLSGLMPGPHTVRVNRQSLPPFFQARNQLEVEVPQPAGSELAVPLTLPIGRNKPNTYMAFGDSITIGDGSRDRTGYRDLLETDLQDFFGRAEVINQGVEGTRSSRGAERIAGALASVRPADTLILYGTNDWNDFRCKQSVPCYTVDSLRAVVRACRAAHSLPFVATIIPANPADPRTRPERNGWVHATDERIRSMAEDEGAVLVDLEAAFLSEAALPPLFSDHVHPNDRGYAIIARELFKAITEPSGRHAPDAVAAPVFRFGARPLPGGMRRAPGRGAGAPPALGWTSGRAGPRA